MPLERPHLLLTDDLMTCLRYLCEQPDPKTGKTPKMGPLVESILRDSEPIQKAAKKLKLKFGVRHAHAPTTDVDEDARIYFKWMGDPRPVGRKKDAKNDVNFKTIACLARKLGLEESSVRSSINRHRARINAR